MKKILAGFALLAFSTIGFAQDVDKMIKQDDVERIIKTLSADDMQGRGTFTPGIEKAAQFIESEYKQIGLKPMEGNTGYRQNFSMIKTTPLKAEVSVNGVAIVPDNIAISASSAFSWSKPGDAEI
ncbi:MAG: peptidase M28, partial [Mucilaginibacter sp.]